ncbi:MAG: glycoside hydrolase domain-containing protein [Nitrospira sp.]
MFSDRSAHWLEIDVVAATDSLVLVLHASGEYLFLDEIEWMPSKTSRLPDHGPVVSNIHVALENSVRRVSREQIQKAELEAERAALPLTSDALSVWSQDPWVEVGQAALYGLPGDQVPSVEVRGYSGEHETVCLGIAVGEEIAKHGLRAIVRGLLPQAVRLYELKAVVAANGKRVYDPLVPLDEGKVIPVRSGIPFYLWVDLNLSALRDGDHRFEIHLEGGQRTVVVPGFVSVKAEQRDVKSLRAFNWAYLSDKPIFHNGSAAVQDLVSHGINTFVVHPSEVPGISLDGNWVIKPNSHFLETVNLAKQHGMVLLYLGWSDTKNPLGFSSTKQSLDPVVKDRLVIWVKELSEHLSHHKLSFDRWALYPVDEPNRHGLRLVKMVAQAVKEWNPSVQVYVNPTIYATPAIEVQDLREAESVVDYWQPNVLALPGRTGEFFKTLKRDWWLYGNPKSPAKLGSPLHDYRMLAWWAWQYGASGVGFWSYSDTGGSSAWNDIDGRRPDWSVVYETPDGVVSSRRWEAFREGLEDYRLLSGVARTEVQHILRIGEQSFDRWNTATVEGVRRALLNAK